MGADSSVWWATLKPTLCWKKNIVIWIPTFKLNRLGSAVFSIVFLIIARRHSRLRGIVLGLHAKRRPTGSSQGRGSEGLLPPSSDVALFGCSSTDWFTSVAVVRITSS